MISKDTMITVENRDAGIVGYTVPDLGITRHFVVGEKKDISMEELRKLSYVEGGMYIIKNCLVIHNQDAVSELLGQVEPEYFYSEADIKNLLLNGTLDELKDCLDFAPEGVLDLVKKMAVKLEINDIAKRKAIKDSLDFDVDRAISINHESAEPDEEAAQPKARRVQTTKAVDAETTAPARRTAAPRYGVKS